jgi:outer membrane cobalamin receptor
VVRRRGADLALTLRVENAFDAEYEAILNYRAPGRTLLLGGRVNFAW